MKSGAFEKFCGGMLLSYIFGAVLNSLFAVGIISQIVCFLLSVVAGIAMVFVASRLAKEYGP